MTQETKKTQPAEGKIPAEAREHFRQVWEEMRAIIQTSLPPGFNEHRQKARREMLLAWRSLIDAHLEKIEELPKKPPK